MGEKIPRRNTSDVVSVPKREILMTQETTKYDNLIDKVENYEFGSQPKKPVSKDSFYPHTLKVHTEGIKRTEEFCRTIGRNLSSDKLNFIYRGSEGDDCVFVEKRQGHLTKKWKRKVSHKNRVESDLWINTVEFQNDGWEKYATFEVTFEKEEYLLEFIRKIKVRVSPNTSSIYFPQKKDRVYKYHWVSKFEDHTPRYPFYIVSKGRGDSRLTSKFFERIKVPYYIVIEPQDYDEYTCVIDEEKILVLPFSNHGDGPGRARNWCWDHSMENGFKRHWVFDDNIRDFRKLHRQRRHPIGDGGMFRVIEDFVDRFKNLPVSGLQYKHFTVENEAYSPFVLNTRIYSALLIENTCPHRWRGRYNEDTILSLDVLKEGLCTAQFNCLLQDKLATQVLGGGNTGEFYGSEGTYNKSKMLEVEHPDVAKVVWRYNRWHHTVDYRPFKANKPIHVDGYDPKPHNKNTELYPFKLEKI